MVTLTADLVHERLWRRTPAQDVVKRVLDLALALIALTALAVPMLVIAVAVRTTGPTVLFRQTRVGRDGRPFTMLKFRTMEPDASDRLHRAFVTSLLRDAKPVPASDGIFKLQTDPRVTRVGAVLRRTSLDEVPQLINVLRGQMSMVGPRPALPFEVELYEDQHRERMRVLPGLTGLWQVSGRGRVSMREALDLDVEYVRRRSLRLDLWILVRTVPAVLSMRGAR